MGKTLLSCNLVAHLFDCKPRDGILGAPTQPLAERLIEDKLYRIFEAVPSLADQIPIERWRSKKELETGEAKWPAAWSGSVSSLADFDATFAYCIEIDKWKYAVAEEGDSHTLIEERTKDNSDSVIINECSPTLKGRSRIEAKYLASNQHTYRVPCPECGRFQTLKFGETERQADGSYRLISGGLKFSLEDPLLSTVYSCHYCKFEIDNRARRAMIRAGVWASKHQTVRRDGRVVGEQPPNHIWGGQLSSLYSLQLTFGQVAYKMMEAHRNPGKFQTIVNGWLGETWEPTRRKRSEPEEVGERLQTDVPRGRVPDWATWIFAAVDLQQDYFKWIVIAAGPPEQIAGVDWGRADSWEEIERSVIDKHWPADEWSAMPAVTLIDAGDGNRTDEVYAFSRKHSRPGRFVLPCKGANSNCNGEPYVRVLIGDGTKTGNRVMRRKAMKARGLVRVRVNPFWYEPMVDKMLYQLLPGQPGSLALPAGAADEIDLLEELCNGAETDTPSKLDPDKLLWGKRFENEPNDWRDALRYARCAVDYKFRSDWHEATRRQPEQPAEPEQVMAKIEPPEPGRRRRRIVRRERTRRGRIRA